MLSGYCYISEALVNLIILYVTEILQETSTAFLRQTSIIIPIGKNRLIWRNNNEPDSHVPLVFTLEGQVEEVTLTLENAGDAGFLEEKLPPPAFYLTVHNVKFISPRFISQLLGSFEIPMAFLKGLYQNTQRNSELGNNFIELSEKLGEGYAGFCLQLLPCALKKRVERNLRKNLHRFYNKQRPLGYLGRFWQKLKKFLFKSKPSVSLLPEMPGQPLKSPPGAQTPADNNVLPFRPR